MYYSAYQGTKICGILQRSQVNSIDYKRITTIRDVLYQCSTLVLLLKLIGNIAYPYTPRKFDGKHGRERWGVVHNVFQST